MKITEYGEAKVVPIKGGLGRHGLLAGSVLRVKDKMKKSCIKDKEI